MISDLIEDLKGWTDERAANPGYVWGLPWGYRSLDVETGGIHPGELTVIGARTGEGKSVLVMTAAMAVARHLVVNDIPGRVLVYSPEMQTRQLMMRYVQMRTGIPSHLVNTGSLDPGQYRLWNEALESMRVYDGRVQIEAQSEMHIDDLLSDIESEQMRDPQSPVRLVVVDYIQYVNGRGGNRYEQVTDVAQKLKLLANRTGIPVLAAAQCARPEKKRFGQREPEEDSPTMFEISDSSYVPRVADNVFILWRPITRWGGKRARLEIAKQRNGGTAVLWFGYDPETTRFTEEDV